MQQDEMVRIISDSPFFQGLAQEERVVLAQLARLHAHAEGEELFRPRQTATALYLVVFGVVEVARPNEDSGTEEVVAYVGPGATLAESKVISGTPFASSARFPEGGATLQWPRPVILRELYSSRELAMQYLHNLARRLEGTFAALGSSSEVRLEGNLEHFHLATILQTIADTGATGVLDITDRRGARFGRILIRDGAVVVTTCGRLSGPGAFIELMSRLPEDGRFSFAASRAVPDGGGQYPLQELLFEAARVADESAQVEAEVPESVPLQPARRQLEWTGVGDLELQEKVWQALQVRPMGWGEVARTLPACRGHVALAVRDLLEAGMITAGSPGARR